MPRPPGVVRSGGVVHGRTPILDGNSPSLPGEGDRLLGLAGDPSPDAADALACAICHAHGGQGLGKLATAGYRMRNGRLI